MTQLASLTDLQAQVPMVAAATLTSALTRASAAFIGAAGWPIELHEATVTLHGDGGRVLHLPARHVLEARVTIDGTTVIAAPAESIRLDGRLGLLIRDKGWPRGLANVAVAYRAGWTSTEIPGDIQAAVLERAIWLASSPAGMTQMTAGPFSVSVGQGEGATQLWSDTVARYAVGVGDRA